MNGYFILDPDQIPEDKRSRYKINEVGQVLNNDGTLRTMLNAIGIVLGFFGY